VIPEAAVEAATIAVQQETYGADWSRRIAKIALAAAAPHIYRTAWNAGYTAAVAVQDFRSTL
jgi:hypothetical protein